MKSLYKFSSLHSMNLLYNISKSPTAINLYTSIPNLEVPSFFLSAFSQKLDIKKSHQYSRSYGNLELIAKLAKIYSPWFQREIDASEVLIVPGSSAAIFAGIQAYVGAGDHVILFEPNDMKYAQNITFHGGEYDAIALKPGKEKWELNLEDFEKKIKKNTKLVILASPQSPIGKVYTPKEIESISNILKKHQNITLLFDASYEKNVFEGEGVYGAINNELWNRSFTIFSADKAFASSGLNLAWVIGPHININKVKYVHNISTFCLYNPLQLALDEALTSADKEYKKFNDFYSYNNSILRGNLEKLLEALQTNEIFKDCEQKIKPKAGFSMFFDISQSKFANIPSRDVMISMGIGIQKEIIVGPGSMYYSKENKSLGEQYLKIDICRSEDEIKNACQRLAKGESSL